MYHILRQRLSPPTRFTLTRILSLSFFLFLISCGTQRKVVSNESFSLADDPALRSAHIGISVFDPASNSYLYNYQGDKYFVPASNTKLFSLYAGLKYLGDSLTGIRYIERDTDLLLLPTGDPTLLHPDFSSQPVIDFLKKKTHRIYIAEANWQEEALGAGWSWDDYNDDYLVERSALPVYGNVIRWVQQIQKEQNQNGGFATSPSVYSIPDVNWKVNFAADTTNKNFFVKRARDENIYEITEGTESSKTQDVPFVTHGLSSAIELLKDTVGINIIPIKGLPLRGPKLLAIHSQPVDSLFRPMMYRSDNFFAEQTLLMVSNERLGLMNDEKIIDTLLKSDLRDLPQKPRWVDGSGLSRYNLFSPQDFVWLLNQLKDEFGMERIKRILPTGGSGTLGNYYKQDSGRIYAKTGSLSGVIALSGYLISSKNRLLIFSVLVNNNVGGGTAIRKAIEKFITGIISQY
jgi:serine-type D-Ala-D-Ala carboxypeptidase/endopeptidase (penicillin-binding protein 4)